MSLFPLKQQRGVQHFHPREHQIKQSHLVDEPVHDIMLRGFYTSDSLPHGLKSPQRLEGILVKPSSVVLVVVVVEVIVEWLGFCAFLLVGAENKSRYIAPVSMACFRYTWLLVTVEI